MLSIKKYFPTISAEQMAQFEQLEPLYRHWNEQINVISRKDIEELSERHVLHSLAIAKIIRFKPTTKVVDVGTGGGFPGIPLAIMFPETDFLLIDSIGKKIKVVKAVAEALGLKNINAQHIRIQEINTKFDFVVSRAVTAFPDFVAMVQKNISSEAKNAIPNGILYLKGGDFISELEPFKKRVEIFEIPKFFDESFFETKKIVYLPIT